MRNKADYLKTWRARNKEAISAYYHKWYLRNRKRLIAKAAAFYQENREATDAYTNAYRKKLTHDRRKKFIKELGGRCVRCGATTGLCFHHKDPDSKRFDIAYRIGGCKLDRIAAEVALTELMCRSCHGKFHHELRKGVA